MSGRGYPVRVELVEHAGGRFTPDTVRALKVLEERARALRGELEVSGGACGWAALQNSPGPTGMPPAWSAVPTGREVLLRIRMLEEQTELCRMHEIAMLWAIAIPLGFTPFARYPLVGSQDAVFHYLGDWVLLMDSLLGVGRGEAGWPSFCCAAQLDVGAWEGGVDVERFVQAQLHRLGYNVGVVDGVIGAKTLAGIRAAKLHSMPLSDVAKRLAVQASKDHSREEVRQGRIELGDVGFSIHTYGQVRSKRTREGVELHINGPGRVVLDLPGS